VGDGAGRPHLSAKEFESTGIAGDLGTDDLQSHRDMEFHVLSFEDMPHAPFSDMADDAEAAVKHIAGVQGSRIRLGLKADWQIEKRSLQVTARLIVGN
jgi:hypothetical protein